MKNWPQIALGELCLAKTGTVDPTKTPDCKFLYIDITSVDVSRKEVTEARWLTGREAPSRARRRVVNGDVIVSMTRPNLNAVALIGPEQSGQVCSTGFCVLRPGPRLNAGYLFHFVRTTKFVQTLTALVSGALYPAVSEAQVRQQVIPLPPLEEQRRVVEILDRAASIGKLRRQAHETARQIVPALFNNMFGDPGKNPMGWPEMTLGQACKLFGGTTLPPGIPYQGQQGGTLLLKVGDLNAANNRIYVSEAREWAASDLVGEQVCPPGTIVFPKRGAAIATNKKRLTQRRAALDPNMMGVAPKEAFLMPEVLLGWFEQMNLADIQSGTTVPQLNKKDLSPLRIFIPDFSVQQAYVACVNKLRLLANRQVCGTDLAAITERSLYWRLLG